jgi:dCMP deaminase
MIELNEQNKPLIEKLMNNGWMWIEKHSGIIYNIGVLRSYIDDVYQEINSQQDLEKVYKVSEDTDRVLESLKNKAQSERPNWDLYFIAQCFLISNRSPDSTKNGAIIVDKDNRVLSQGYNGHISGIDDSLIPNTRPEKYPFRIHAEENAILFLNQPIFEGTKIYVTGRPCHKCTRMILQKGIRTIIYGPQESVCVDGEDVKASQKMIDDCKAKVTIYNDIEAIKKEFNKLVNRMTTIEKGNL